MLKITSSQLDVLRNITRQYLPAVKLPSEDSWRAATDNAVWLRVVSQVVVVGAAAPARKLHDKDVNAMLSWHSLTQLSEGQARQVIWSALRSIGARYTGKTSDACRKTTALVRNLATLKRYQGGPKGFIKDVARLQGPSAKKVAFVATHLSYVKNKGARDFLISGFGLIRNHVALDSRVVGILQDIGIHIPKECLSNAVAYAEAENDLIEQVCLPLAISGAELDQMLFNNYQEIKLHFSI